MKNIKNVIFIAALTFSLLLFFSGCISQDQNKDVISSELLEMVESGEEQANADGKTSEAAEDGEEESGENETAAGQELSEEFEYPPYLSLYEGLHVTGNPIEVDIEEYRLEVAGAVDNPLRLTFGEIKDLESVEIYSELVCPGFFVDEGNWTGVEVKNILDIAEIQDNALEVTFISIDGSYSKTLSIEKINGEGFLLAYEFEGKEFSVVHGFPIRLVAAGEPGSVWVKWLGKIEVS